MNKLSRQSHFNHDCGLPPIGATHPSSPASGLSGRVLGFVPANSAATYKPVPSPYRTVPSPGASALGSFSLSLNTFLDVSAVIGVVAGYLSDGVVLAHQKGRSKTINLFLFLPRFNS